MREPARRGILRGLIALTTQLKKFLFFFFSKLVNKHWAAMQSWSGCWGSSSSSSTDAADWDHLDASSFKYHYPLILILPLPLPPPSMAQASPQLHTWLHNMANFFLSNGCKMQWRLQKPHCSQLFLESINLSINLSIIFNGLISIIFFDLRILWVQLQSRDICWIPWGHFNRTQNIMNIDLINHQLNAAAQ